MEDDFIANQNFENMISFEEECKKNLEILIKNIDNLGTISDYSEINDVRTSLVINDLDRQIIDVLGNGMYGTRNKNIQALLRVLFYILKHPNFKSLLEDKEIRTVVLFTVSGYKNVFLEEIEKISKLYSFNDEMQKYCEVTRKMIEDKKI